MRSRDRSVLILAGPFSEGIFITLVVLSQIGLFVCSSVASKGAGFHYEDQVVTIWDLSVVLFSKYSGTTGEAVGFQHNCTVTKEIPSHADLTVFADR